LRFRVASALLVQFEEASQKTGLEMLRTLAENNYSDAMVYYGMCLNDGRAGMEPNSEEAVSWFKRCSELHGHPQSQYELGVAFYTGEGVAENEDEAVRLFKLAAQQHHAAACYMLGDCLLDGVGLELDRASALEWLVLASELGHRGARSRVMAVLEKKEGEDYGVFTDASRQTLVEHVAPPANKEGRLVQRRTTLLRERTGGRRDPTELVRRQTIVGNSRKE
jgi:TPR repeat protein